MKRHWLLTALGAILAGAGLHFLWQALPNPLFALISPVNESVWEHLKLLYWPMLAAALVLARGPRRIAVWAGFFPAIVLQPVFLLALYYGLRALGVQGLAVDLTHPTSMACFRVGFQPHGQRSRCVRCWLPLMKGVACSFARPALGIFERGRRRKKPSGAGPAVRFKLRK
ncbi:MAG: DUF6512 family protein [Oscillospiraceae bacterium]